MHILSRNYSTKIVTQQRLKMTRNVYVLRLTASSSLLGKRPAPARSLSNGNRRRRLPDPPSTMTSRESEHALSQIPRKLHLPQQTCADSEDPCTVLAPVSCLPPVPRSSRSFSPRKVRSLFLWHQDHVAKTGQKMTSGQSPARYQQRHTNICAAQRARSGFVNS